MTEPARKAETVAAKLSAGAARLAAAGIPQPRREARLLLAHALGVDQAAIIGAPDRPVRDAVLYDALVKRRARREPFSHLTGIREFWSLRLKVTPDVLDPRPDSETLVEAALQTVRNRGAALRIADFGTGSGCLLLALLSELPNAFGIGIDRSRAALSVAIENAAALGLGSRTVFIQSDWGGSLAGPFDLIVANPPYIPSADIDALQPEVAVYEPREALDGGADGFDSYRALAPDFVRLLVPGGAVVVECGAGQETRVAEILRQTGLDIAGFRTDLSGNARCVVGRKVGDRTFPQKRGWSAEYKRLISARA